MTPRITTADRRRFLAAATTLPFWTVPGAFAQEVARTPTPPQTEGPFYPNRLPLDTDNDLLILNDNMTPAVGEITHLTGKVLDPRGNPVRNALVEIWQCDARGVYLHTADSGPKQAQQDRNFQGFGRFLTGSTGEYYFRTIKPVPYPGRTPHIHVKVKLGRRELLVTQLYVKDHEGNARDGIYRGASNTPQRKAAIDVAFVPVPGSRTGELNAAFDIVLGQTPAEAPAAPR